MCLLFTSESSVLVKTDPKMSCILSVTSLADRTNGLSLSSNFTLYSAWVHFVVVVARFAYYVIKVGIESTNDGMFYISWHTVSLFQDAVIRILFYVVEFGILTLEL